MHAGAIDTEKTVPGRLYAYLKGRPGVWMSHWELVTEIRTTAVSTYVSNVRLKCPAGEVVETERLTVDGRKGWYSRWRASVPSAN